MNTHHIMAAGCLTLLITSHAGHAQASAKVNLSSWDADSDRVISQEEWRATLDEHGFFDLVDTNDNDAFDAKEARGAALQYEAQLDRNGDGRIDRDEFELGLFQQHDGDEDAQLSDMEWAGFVAESDGSPLFN